MVTVFSGFTASDLLDDFDVLYEMAVLDKVRIKREKEENKKKAEEDKIAAEKERIRRLAEEDAYKKRISILNEWNKVSEKSAAQNPEDVLSKLIKVKGIYILNTEVTNGLYYKVMMKKSDAEIDALYPVSNISYIDAIIICNKLSELCGLKPYYGVPEAVDNGKYISCKIYNTNGFRLPNVKEWLYAAEGGQKFRYSGSDKFNDVGWYIVNSKLNGEGNYIKHPVALKKANGYGLYDMSGNVSEMCIEGISKNKFACYSVGSNYESSSVADKIYARVIKEKKIKYCSNEDETVRNCQLLWIEV